MAGFAARSAGVYLQNATEAPEPGLTTGVPAFLGPVASFPAADPGSFLLDPRTFAELDSRPGPAWAGRKLRLAVRGFFENGGKLCRVVPLAGPASLGEALSDLAARDGFDLVVAPSLTARPPGLVAAGYPAFLATVAAAHASILMFCARRGDCFALLDSPEHTGLGGDWHQETSDYREALDAAIVAAAAVPPPTPHLLPRSPEDLRVSGALYTPWATVREDGDIQEYDEIADNGDVALHAPVPVSGHVAGIFARLDDTNGAHKAPANEVAMGLLDLQIRLDAAAEAAVSPDGASRFNCLRPFPGRGIRVWGARTLGLTPEWAHIGARRTAIALRRFIDFTMPSMAFEPNDLRLWIRIQRELTSFLNRLFEQGALKGGSASEAFYVKCDGETNSQAVRDAGQVVTEIGLALATPKEFIVVRLTHGAASAAASTSAAAP